MRPQKGGITARKSPTSFPSGCGRPDELDFLKRGSCRIHYRTGYGTDLIRWQRHAQRRRIVDFRRRRCARRPGCQTFPCARIPDVADQHRMRLQAWGFLDMVGMTRAIYGRLRN